MVFRTLLAFFILTLLCAGNVLAEAAPPPPAATLRIGVIQSLTGIAAEDGKTTLQALELAAEEINKSRNVQVQLLVEDDATDPVKSVSAYKKLRGEKVQAIIGPTWSFTVNAVLPFAAQDKMILVNTSTLPECLAFESAAGFLYSTAISVNEHANAFVRYLKHHGVKSAVLFYTSNSWGEAQRIAYTKVLREHGVTILKELQSTNFDISDWRALLPQVKALNADVWLLLLNKTDLETVIRRGREIKTSSRFYASYHVGDLLRLASDKSFLEDVCYSCPANQLTTELEFAQKFRSRYEEDPKVFADSSYDALFLLHHAFALSNEKGMTLKEALESSEMRGTAGNYRFSKDSSFSTGKVDLLCVKHGNAAAQRAPE